MLNKKMTEENRKILTMLYDIRKRHEDCMENIQKIRDGASKMLMSKNRTVEIAGMFPVDQDVIKYLSSPYKGKLTNDSKRMDFKYFFDDKDRIILTERYTKGKLHEYYFYFYYDGYAEGIQYRENFKELDTVYYFEWENSKIKRYLTFLGSSPEAGYSYYRDTYFNFFETGVELTQNTCSFFAWSKEVKNDEPRRVIAPLL